MHANESHVSWTFRNGYTWIIRDSWDSQHVENRLLLDTTKYLKYNSVIKLRIIVSINFMKFQSDIFRSSRFNIEANSKIAIIFTTYFPTSRVLFGVQSVLLCHQLVKINVRRIQMWICPESLPMFFTLNTIYSKFYIRKYFRTKK